MAYIFLFTVFVSCVFSNLEFTDKGLLNVEGSSFLEQIKRHFNDALKALSKVPESDVKIMVVRTEFDDGHIFEQNTYDKYISCKFITKLSNYFHISKTSVLIILLMLSVLSLVLVATIIASIIKFAKSRKSNKMDYEKIPLNGDKECVVYVE